MAYLFKLIMKPALTKSIKRLCKNLKEEELARVLIFVSEIIKEDTTQFSTLSSTSPSETVQDIDQDNSDLVMCGENINISLPMDMDLAHIKDKNVVVEKLKEMVGLGIPFPLPSQDNYWLPLNIQAYKKDNLGIICIEIINTRKGATCIRGTVIFENGRHKVTTCESNRL